MLATASFAANASYVSMAGVSPGPGTVVSLAGLDASGDVIARGSSCPVDFPAKGATVPLYFAPTNFFAPTVGAPLAARADPIAVPLAGGGVLLAGGADGSGPRMDAELFSPGSATFAAAAPSLATPRTDAEVALVPGFGALVTGGLDASGTPVADGEVYNESLDQFQPFPNQLLDQRVGHRAVVFSDGLVLVTGGRSPTATALASTAFVRIQVPSGSAQVTAGPAMITARSEHAAVVANDVALVIGGNAADGTPLDSIEALQPATMTAPAFFEQIATMKFARAESTASLLRDGEILIVGGAGDAAGTPRGDAELYNPILRTTTVFSLATKRRGAHRDALARRPRAHRRRHRRRRQPALLGRAVLPARVGDAGLRVRAAARHPALGPRGGAAVRRHRAHRRRRRHRRDLYAAGDVTRAPGQRLSPYFSSL